MKVVCISGKAQHGKDTTAGMMKTVLESMGHTVLIAHYGDLVKYVCRTFFGWNGEKDAYGRSLLQKVGTDIVREQRPNFWVDFIKDLLSMFPNEWDFVLIPDSRFPNEIDGLKQSGFNVIHLRVRRENFESPLTTEQQNHPSETALDHVVPDFLIVNDGTLEDLYNKVCNLVVDRYGVCA
jgi:hypothetical protein